jgi:hypothetical protein
MKMEHKTTTKAGDTKVETTKSTTEEHMERHLHVSSMKHIAPTCP